MALQTFARLVLDIVSEPAGLVNRHDSWVGRRLDELWRPQKSLVFGRGGIWGGDPRGHLLL